MPIATERGVNGRRRAIVSSFEARYGTPPTALVRAPGRVNLIGEHTDYNEGFVLPMAIDRCVWIASRAVPEDRVRLYSLNFDEEGAFDLDVGSPPAGGAGAGRWIEYVKGVAWALRDRGHALRGWDGVVAGDVPIGAGLSSSAALEMAVARTFTFASDLTWNPAAMACVAQKAENGWIGVNCGIMDQMICATGRRDHAVLLDCRTLEGTHVPLPPDTVVVALDTGTARRLADSAFNERRTQCEAAAAHFGVVALRDLDNDRFSAESGALDEVTRRRVRHVIGENGRTVDAAQAMTRRDAPTLGALMLASHASLRDNFDVSTPALDLVVQCARARPECFGARMTGAGFGGCVVAVIDRQRSERFLAQVATDCVRAGGRAPRCFVLKAADGASCEFVHG